MRSSMSLRLTIAFALTLLFLCLGSLTADATCAEARLIRSYDPSAGEFSGVVSGCTAADDSSCTGLSHSSRIAGSFWEVGQGDPAQGTGIDNGYFPALEAAGYGYSGWLSAFYSLPPIPSVLDSRWNADPGIDGCPSTSNACMAVLLGDTYAAGQIAANTHGYFAYLTQRANPAGDFLFVQPGGADIFMQQIPRPALRSRTELSGGITRVQIDAPELNEEGIYPDSTCPGAAPVAWTLFAQSVPAGSAPPVDRSAMASWIQLIDSVDQTELSFAQDGFFDVTVASDQDLYLAHGIIFADGFATPFLGANSVRILNRDACETPVGSPVSNCEQLCLERDVDRDGLLDDCENCPQRFNPDQADGDGDGRGDVCDNCPDDFNDAQLDGDADSFGDACDNCPLDRNPSQSDRDQDGSGDPCDTDDGAAFLRFTGPTTADWESEVDALSWNLYRGDGGLLSATGSTTQLPGANPLAEQSCGLLTSQSLEELSGLAAGALQFVLVSIESASGEGAIGATSAGADRTNEAPCP